jgi:hypothetical protein
MADYCTILEAQAYFDTRLHTDAWDEASDTDRGKAIAMATRIIDQLNYKGSKTDSAQTNQFPRGGDIVVPDAVKNACAEISLALLDGVDPELEADNLHMQSQGYSQVKSTYDVDIIRAQTIAGVPSRTAWTYLMPYLRDPRDMQLTRV